jgi:AraC-like DNA-binding protein
MAQPSTKRANLVRAGMLASYAELARSLRLDPIRQLKDVGLHRVDFSDGDTLIPAAAVFELLERSADATGIEDFGLRLATMRTLAQLGAVGLLVREEPTVGHAIRAAEQYFHSHSDSLAFRLAEHKNSAVLRIRLLSVTHGRTRQMTELIIGSTFRTISVLAGSAWSPEAVAFSHPPPKTRTIHDGFFKTKALFDNSFNGFILRGSDLSAPIRTAETAMPDYIKRYVEEVAAQPAATMDATVRQLVFALLPSGRCTSIAIANRLGVDRKTVSRQLASQGETFSSILNDVRVELARRHIHTGHKSLTETAQLLGFSGLATFSRWFRSEFGMSATSWGKAASPRSEPRQAV